jgi:uncharacterized Fe-S cluster-containing radical SAM superfamily protein
MKKGLRQRQYDQLARLRRLLDLSQDPDRPRRVRTRAARYAAAVAEQVGILTRPPVCAWCHRRQRLQRHHWDYDEPLEVTFLCPDCHRVADSMNPIINRSIA